MVTFSVSDTHAHMHSFIQKMYHFFFLLPEADLELFVAGPINTQMDDFVKCALSNYVGRVVINKSQ